MSTETAKLIKHARIARIQTHDTLIRLRKRLVTHQEKMDCILADHELISNLNFKSTEEHKSLA